MKNFMNFIYSMILTFVVNVKGLFEDGRQEERGASDLVTVVALIVIVLAVALIFKSQLTNIINVVGNKVISWVNNG